jgi:hypothetical protein
MTDGCTRRRGRRLKFSLEGLEERLLLATLSRIDRVHPVEVRVSSAAQAMPTEDTRPPVQLVQPPRSSDVTPELRAAKSRRAHGPQVEFSQSVFDVEENAGMAVIQVARTGSVKSKATVSVATTGAGSAVAGVDFTPIQEKLVFAKGVRRQTFDVPVLDDPAANSDLTVGLALSAPRGKVALGEPSTATLVIEDNDQPPPAADIQFAATTFQQDDNAGTAEIQVGRTGDSQATVTVTVATTGAGSAVAGVNFTPTVQTLTFGPGVDTQTFNVPVLDDHVIGPDVTVGLALSAPGGDAVLGSPSTASLVIHNVDQPPPAADIQFSATSYEVDNNAGIESIQVTRTVDTQVAVSVTVATTSTGSAVPNVDFTPAEETLTFSPGVDTQTFNVPVLDDHVIGPDVTVGLALSAPGGDAVLGSPSTASLVIHNVDPPTDLVIESLQATPSASGNGSFELTASVTNQGSYYAGGGYVTFFQNSETTTLNPPNADGSPPAVYAVPSPNVPLGSPSIPSMVYGQTETFTVTATSRAMYTAEIVSDPNSSSPGITGVTGPTGDAISINNLQPQSFTVTNSLIDAALNLSGATAEIDASNSFLDIPGLVDEHFTVPSFSVDGITYSANQIIANSFEVSLDNGSIVLTIAFNDNANALISPDGPPIGVTGFSVTLTLPIVFDATEQYLQIANPTVSCQGNWYVNILGFDSSISGVDSLIATQITTLIDEPDYHEPIEYGLNVEVRNFFQNSEILSLTSGPTSLTFNLDSP